MVKNSIQRHSQTLMTEPNRTKCTFLIQYSRRHYFIYLFIYYNNTVYDLQ